MRIDRKTFREAAGATAKKELESYEPNAKGWLMLLLVNYTERLEKVLWGAEDGNKKE